ncbi:hypothetical protein IFO70_36200 [Phormidium tenue FACHB-886]|nr:hypothetical protein [Phormidium tenue FACHB-886]
MQPNNPFDTLTYTDAHIAISQYKQGRGMWFEQIPHVGELVYFQHPQGQGIVTFKVMSVHHYPSEEINPLQTQLILKCLITLSPFVPQPIQ